jgi:hypothetical protein
MVYPSHFNRRRRKRMSYIHIPALNTIHMMHLIKRSTNYGAQFVRSQ